MGGMFNGCCGSTVEKENGESKTKSSNSKSNKKNKDTSLKDNNKKTKKSRRSKNREDSFDDLNKIDCQQANETPVLNANINFMAPKTLKLLTSIGEIKNYQQNTLESNQIEKDLITHADILVQFDKRRKKWKSYFLLCTHLTS